MPALDQQNIEQRLGEMPQWSLADGQITRTYTAATFHRGIGFVTQIAILADVADHHPDIDIRYNSVRIALSTHSEGGITEKDFALARQIDEAFAQ
jgi:4a-hydroxytetrahydrobiopterin dehydratase